MHGIDGRERLGAMGVADDDVCALARLDAADFLLEASGARRLDGLHLDDCRRREWPADAGCDQIGAMAGIADQAVERAVDAECDGATFLPQFRQAAGRLVADPQLQIGCGTPDHLGARLHDQPHVLFVHDVHVDETGILGEHADVVRGGGCAACPAARGRRGSGRARSPSCCWKMTPDSSASFCAARSSVSEAVPRP